MKINKRESRSMNGEAGENPRADFFKKSSQTGVGVYDGLSALVAAKWQFDFVWVSSFCCSAAAGLSDVGIIGPDEILAVIRCVQRSVKLPIVVDIDSGYGDPVKAYHVVEAMARAGASALCIEDNPVSKRCSLYDGYERALVSIEEHNARIRAARAGVEEAGTDCRIIARTEAMVAGLGVAEALRRARAYVEAGANAVFVQSLDASGEEVLQFAREWQRKTPIFIAPTRFPQVTKKELYGAGITHIIFANQCLRAAHAAAERTFGILAKADAPIAVESEISPVSTVAKLVGAEEVAQLEALLACNGVEKPSAQPLAQPGRKSLARTRSVRMTKHKGGLHAG